jgi:hypothetical protein
MVYELGDYIQTGDGSLEFINLDYTPCPCRDFYLLDPESSLFLYLKTHCRGWTESPHGFYTLNYIMIVLLANWSQKNLIVDCTFLRANEDESLIFTFKETSLWAYYYGIPHKWAPLHKIRSFIAQKYFGIEIEKRTSLLLCCPSIEKILKTLLDTEIIDTGLLHCRCPD